MHCAHLGGEVRDIADMGDAQTLRAHRLDVLRPWIDEGDVLAGLRHMCSGIPADRARAHNRYLQAHLSLLLASISGIVHEKDIGCFHRYTTSLKRLSTADTYRRGLERLAKINWRVYRSAMAGSNITCNKRFRGFRTPPIPHDGPRTGTGA